MLEGAVDGAAVEVGSGCTDWSGTAAQPTATKAVTSSPIRWVPLNNLLAGRSPATVKVSPAAL